MYDLLILTAIAAFLQPSEGLFSAKSVSEFFVENGKYKTLKSKPDYPYMVEIERFKTHLCGGTLIGRGVVITAGHCFVKTITTGLQVKAGHIYRESENAPGLQKSGVDIIVKHPDYFDKTINGQSEIYFDLAIVKLKKLFDITPFVNVAILAPYGNEEDYKGKVATALGWGTIEDGKLSADLKKVELIVLSPAQCKAEVGVNDYIKSLLCAKGKNNKGGFGGGDSGGPLVIHHPKNPQKDVLLGVISFSFDKTHHVFRDRIVPNEKRPSVTSNIAVFHQWIEKIVDIFRTQFEKELG